MQYDYRTRFLRKIQSSKKHFSNKLIFRTFCCKFAVITLGEKGLSFSEKKSYVFGSEKFLKIRFYLNSVTILIFSKNRQTYNTPAASTWFHFDIMNMRGKEMKTEYSRNRVFIFFPKLSYLSSIERNLVIPKWTRKIFRTQVCINVIRFYIMTENMFWLRILLVFLR